MAVPSGFYVGQVGAQIKLDTQDTNDLLASATALRIYYRRPKTGATGFWPAVLEGTKLVFTTSTIADLPEDGEYSLQAYVEGANYKIFGRVAVMLVELPLAAIT